MTIKPMAPLVPAEMAVHNARAKKTQFIFDRIEYLSRAERMSMAFRLKTTQAQEAAAVLIEPEIDPNDPNDDAIQIALRKLSIVKPEMFFTFTQALGQVAKMPPPRDKAAIQKFLWHP